MVGGGRSCAVVGCQSRSSAHKDKHFYRFPSDQILSDVWKSFTRRGTDFTLKKSSVMCQDHFDPSCFVAKKKQVTLAKNTVPTIFYRSSPEGEEKIVLTFDQDVMHYIEADTLLNPVYDREKREEELLTKRKRKLDKFGRLCRFCLEDRDQEKLMTISKLKDYSINPNEVMALIGIDPKYNDLFGKSACEDCFQQIFVFDGYRKRCKKTQDQLVNELKDIEKEIQMVCGYSEQSSWMKTEMANWSEDEDAYNDSFGSSRVKSTRQSNDDYQFHKIIVKEERKDEAPDIEYQDFHLASVTMDESAAEEDCLSAADTDPNLDDAEVPPDENPIKAMTQYETDTYDIKDVFVSEKHQSSNSRIYECFYCRLVSGQMKSEGLKSNSLSIHRNTPEKSPSPSTHVPSKKSPANSPTAAKPSPNSAGSTPT
jgi:hypothetical protein